MALQMQRCPVAQQPTYARRIAFKACTSRSQSRIGAVVASKSVSGTMADLKAKGKVAFIPFIVAGDPDLETTATALQRLDALGANVIELGVPYSDPLADGPAIQSAATRALEKGTTLDAVISMVSKVAPKLKAPLVMFTYYNPVIRRGVDKFMQQIKAAGASGLLVPDIPLEETDAIREAGNKYGIELVLLVTPTTPPARMARIVAASQGFVYLVSYTGVTGSNDGNLEARVEGLVKDIQKLTDKPVCVGFGVSKPHHAQQIASWGAEGVICGSALVRALGEAPSREEGLKAMESIARSLRDAVPSDAI